MVLQDGGAGDRKQGLGQLQGEGAEPRACVKEIGIMCDSRLSKEGVVYSPKPHPHLGVLYSMNQS